MPGAWPARAPRSRLHRGTQWRDPRRRSRDRRSTRELRVHRSVQAAVFRRDVRHVLAVHDVDEGERRGRDKILQASLCADVRGKMRAQRVLLRVVEPDAVGHRRVDVDDNDAAPAWLGAVDARTIHAVRGTQQIGKRPRGSWRGEYALIERRCWSACMSGLPISLRGAGSVLASRPPPAI